MNKSILTFGIILFVIFFFFPPYWGGNHESILFGWIGKEPSEYSEDIYMTLWFGILGLIAFLTFTLANIFDKQTMEKILEPSPHNKLEY
ncbi:MAG: hypothetical protein WBD30_03620 [Bacteroidota bacterium]